MPCLVTKKISITHQQGSLWGLLPTFMHQFGNGILCTLSPNHNIHEENCVYQWWTKYALKAKSVSEMHFPAIWRSKFTDLANSKKTQSLGGKAVGKSAWIDAPNIKFFICWLSLCYQYTKLKILSDQRWHVQVYKVLHRKDESLKALLNVDRTSITRKHKFKLNKPYVKNNVHKYLFSRRVINNLSSLPPGDVNEVSL